MIGFVRDHYRTDEFIPLHAPVFAGREKQYVSETIDSTFVSSVGHFVSDFEDRVADYTGSPGAVATVNGTAALQVALVMAGVGSGDLVITQPMTFVATCNAIHYCGADPVFVDIDAGNLGLSPAAVERWLECHCHTDQAGVIRHSESGRRVAACVPMHTFGHPADLDGLAQVSERWNLAMVEDAAESLGSFYRGRHTGTFGLLGALSFNGNKIITTGGGGMILADSDFADRARHLTTTAKVAHPYEYVHDEVGFNYRMPNLNAALGVAQMEQLEAFIAEKRQLASEYQALLSDTELTFVAEPEGCRSNYWLNAVLCPSRRARDELLASTNDEGVMTRPAWRLMCDLRIYADCLRDDLTVARDVVDRLVNLPSSVRLPAP
ncbi:MAG: LegC family aminotransferase [Marinobacter sp.]|uniref:LegC family aminotransferase n=1 Tax=Marinobacter sp. TaxID=50741 RepID=UPI00299EC88A|nr:LegC family aminotransferase [Marinobacter sp.]MDX1754693.1 LegC family aminotransferase [Marinobacter sp.]